MPLSPLHLVSLSHSSERSSATHLGRKECCSPATQGVLFSGNPNGNKCFSVLVFFLGGGGGGVRRYCSKDTGGFGSGNDDGLGSVEFCLEDASDLAPALSQTTLSDLEVWVRWRLTRFGNEGGLGLEVLL
jgi:hypothetical protein